MNKGIKLAIAASVAAMTITSAAADGVNIVIDGESAVFTYMPFIDEGTTFVPMRAIFERLGAEIDWIANTKTVKAKLRDTEISLAVGSEVMYKNGGEVKLAKAAVILNDRTYVPLRAVSEAFGAEVSWEESTGTVIISTVKGEQTEKAEATASPAPQNPTAAYPTPQPIKDKTNEKTPVQSQTTDAYPLSENARIRIWMEMRAQAKAPDEIGVLISGSKQDMRAGKGSFAVAYSADITVNDYGYEYSGPEVSTILDLKKSGLTLEEEKNYYYRVYIVSDGIRYWGRDGSFTTEKRPVDFNFLTGETTDITSSGATLRGVRKAEKRDYNLAVEEGFYFGSSEDNMKKLPFVTDDEGNKMNRMFWNDDDQTITNIYKLQEDADITLQPNTEYFWKYYAVWGEEEFTSETISFTTSKE